VRLGFVSCLCYVMLVPLSQVYIVSEENKGVVRLGRRPCEDGLYGHGDNRDIITYIRYLRASMPSAP
jgi:hypothetical protein